MGLLSRPWTLLALLGALGCVNAGVLSFSEDLNKEMSNEIDDYPFDQHHGYKSESKLNRLHAKTTGASSSKFHKRKHLGKLLGHKGEQTWREGSRIIHKKNKKISGDERLQDLSFDPPRIPEAVRMTPNHYERDHERSYNGYPSQKKPQNKRSQRKKGPHPKVLLQKEVQSSWKEV
eukprot:TRINITY_DN315_c0_g1_i6.p1 TRINITY_DN315_c0_g1~~TRINITY_DN315_c0_g1_i6.p1  ORF type:complete len:176 (-),score=48.17 TRINITY_DN315_c0_g1_i6:266-793(-)